MMKNDTDIVIERPQPDYPNRGKVLAVITPHLDDTPIYAAGTVAKLIAEGYTGYLIHTSNDETASHDVTIGETICAIEIESQAVGKVLGLSKIYNLHYRNHRLDDISRIELRSRLIFLFRLLKVNTVFSFDPWAHDEENPDHYVTSQAVEAACWMAGGEHDYPEHFDAGLKPWAVIEKYYYSRFGHMINRVVDISSTIDIKVEALLANHTHALNMMNSVKTQLAQQGLMLPALNKKDDDVLREFVNITFKCRDAQVGEKYGLQYAEEYHYIGPNSPFPISPNPLGDYVRKNAIQLE
jgi:LmbE family N-acetylglucosaminyl deacetylase